MKQSEIIEKRRMETKIRDLFNFQNGCRSQKVVCSIGELGAAHEFDIFEAGKVIGGITTSAWNNKTGSNNTGGQDRVSAELLWLSLWPGSERRVMILSGQEMAEKLFKRFQGCHFPSPIEIFNYNAAQKCLEEVGTLSK